MLLPNPYETPKVAVETVPRSFRYSIGSIIASVLFVALAATSTYFGYAAYRLTIDYPGLNDPSPNVDGYWPAVVNLIYKIFAAISGLLAMMVAVIWGYCSHARRTKMKISESLLLDSGTT